MDTKTTVGPGQKDPASQKGKRLSAGGAPSVTLSIERSRKREALSTKIVPLPRPGWAAAHVLIDGHCYCGFRSREAAVIAKDLWEQNWPATEGMSITVASFSEGRVD